MRARRWHQTAAEGVAGFPPYYAVMTLSSGLLPGAKYLLIPKPSAHVISEDHLSAREETCYLGHCAADLGTKQPNRTGLIEIFVSFKCPPPKLICSGHIASLQYLPV